MHFTAQTSANGVLERDFVVGDVPGVLWAPESGGDGAPLILMGHPGGLHKKARGVVDRAHHYVTTRGFTVASIDSPGHGDRPRSADDDRWVAAMGRARAAGEPIAAIVTEFNESLAERAVPEWRAVLDALLAVPDIGADAPVGYSGMTLATTIGMPLTAADARIKAAVFGGAFQSAALITAARRITVPVTFILSWDDAELDRESGLALFDAFASPEKTLHAHSGTHFQVPWQETEDSVAFFHHHLTPP